MDAPHPDPARAGRTLATSAIDASAKGQASYGGLDLLRLGACLSVAIYHYSFRGSSHDHFTDFAIPRINFATKYGYFGVELFFIISGFVITLSTIGRDPAEFLISRFARLYPGFLYCMSITFGVMMIFGQPSFLVTWQQWFANLFIIAPALGQPFVDGAYWSLVCEIIFYAWVFGLKLVRIFDEHVLAIVIVWSAFSAVDLIFIHSTIVSTLLLTKYSGYFCAGMLIYERCIRRRLSATIVLVGLVLPLALLQTREEIAYHQNYYTGTSFDPLVGGTACVLMISVVALAVAVPRYGPRRRLILLAGGATYPLYLLHQNIGYLILNRFVGSVPARYLLTGTVSAVLLLAIAVWHFVEKPGQRFVSARLLPLVRRVRLRRSQGS